MYKQRQKYREGQRLRERQRDRLGERERERGKEKYRDRKAESRGGSRGEALSMGRIHPKELWALAIRGRGSLCVGDPATIGHPT